MSNVSPFVRLFSDELMVRITSLFIRRFGRGYTLEELSQKLDEPVHEICPYVKQLLEIDVVTEEMSDGETRYVIDPDHPVANHLGAAANELLSYSQDIPENLESHSFDATVTTR